MARSRWPNIAKNLANSSREALIIAIEIHNKPVCGYRLPAVVILVVHSWELLVKAYSYKYLKDKKILEKNEENRYKQFSSILENIYHTNPKKFRIFYENLTSLNDWRNIIVHWSPLEALDELIYEFITKSIILYRDFITEFFPKESLNTLEDIPLLPILFKLPFSTTELLTKKSASQNASKEVLEFLEKVQEKTRKLAEEGIDEMIFIWIRTEFTHEKKNGDLVAKIENNNPDAIIYSKNSKIHLVNEPWAQNVRSLTNSEITQLFPICKRSGLEKMFKSKFWWTFSGHSVAFNKIHKQLVKSEFWKSCQRDPLTWSYRYSHEFLNKLTDLITNK